MRQEFHAAYHKYARAREACGLPFVPKSHQLAHFVRQLLRFGSPAAFANWIDEQGNIKLKAVARVAHREVWHARILSEMKRL